MNVIQLIMSSGAVVLLILIFLFFLSVLSWSVAFKKWKEYGVIHRNNQLFLDVYRKNRKLNDIFILSKEMPMCPYILIFQRGYEEFLRIRDRRATNEDARDVIVEHFSKFGFTVIERSLKTGVNDVNEKLDAMVPILASIGSISPFIGLFGTVWGIIDAFMGLSGGGTSLDAVAPGIAEALIATAIGLFAAIPSVLFYNYFNNESSKLNIKMETFCQDFLNMTERLVMGLKKAKDEP